MTIIPPRLRHRIDAVAHELFDIANALRPDRPTLAAVYDALGHAIEGSHYGAKRYGGHTFRINKLPKGCVLEISPRLPDDDGSRAVSITVP